MIEKIFFGFISCVYVGGILFLLSLIAAEILTGGAIAFGIDGQRVFLILFIVEIDDTLLREKMTVTGVSAGHNAVE
jgi:hypothetical protein